MHEFNSCSLCRAGSGPHQIAMMRLTPVMVLSQVIIQKLFTLFSRKNQVEAKWKAESKAEDKLLPIH